MSAGFRPAGLPVLTYHAIDASRGVTATDPSWFAETLAALGEAGHRAVDLAEWIASGRPEVGRGFAVAFDDGLRSVLDVKRERDAVILICTEHGLPPVPGRKR